MRFDCHRVFWHDEWKLGRFTDVEMIFTDVWTDEILKQRLRDVLRLSDVRCGLQLVWSDSLSGRSAFSHRLQFFRCGLSDEAVRDAENQALWNYHYRFLSSKEMGPDVTPPMFHRIADQWRPDAVWEKRNEKYRLLTTPDDRHESPPNKGAPNRPEYLPRDRELGIDDKTTETATTFEVEFSNQPDQSRAIEQCLAALKIAQREFGPPRVVEIEFKSRSETMPKYVKACAEIGRPCDSWKFVGEYRKQFSPYTCPSYPTTDVVSYPVLEAHQLRVLSPAKLYLRASMVWKGQEGFLELQTTEGPEYLQEIADAAGVEIEIWDGPLADRWGLYSD
ncbi:MAG: hypothetical protein ACK5Q5_07955 [Planctomycetaceae bacterium]